MCLIWTHQAFPDSTHPNQSQGLSETQKHQLEDGHVSGGKRNYQQKYADECALLPLTPLPFLLHSKLCILWSHISGLAGLSLRSPYDQGFLKLRGQETQRGSQRKAVGSNLSSVPHTQHLEDKGHDVDCYPNWKLPSIKLIIQCSQSASFIVHFSNFAYFYHFL